MWSKSIEYSLREGICGLRVEYFSLRAGLCGLRVVSGKEMKYFSLREGCVV